uniref:Uncharacterized protein n=1 Tax=Globodera rostochiensis TaxID=31243 RepID=A0A914H4J1_GLORO
MYSAMARAELYSAKVPKTALAFSWEELASFYAQPPETKSAGFAVKFATTLLHMPELLEQVGVVIWCMEWFMAIMTMAVTWIDSVYQHTDLLYSQACPRAD